VNAPPEEQLQWAFDTLKNEFGVPDLLVPKDMTSGKPDDKSVMVSIPFYSFLSFLLVGYKKQNNNIIRHM
jgi:hypothetical protein